MDKGAATKGLLIGKNTQSEVRQREGKERGQRNQLGGPGSTANEKTRRATRWKT